MATNQNHVINTVTCKQNFLPINIVLLETDNNDFTSVLDQDKYTVYQDSFEDEHYAPGIEEIALIISVSESVMSTAMCSKLLNYFRNGGNVLCHVKDDSIFSSIRGICSRKFQDYQKFWIKQSSQWISPNDVKKIDKRFIQSHFSTFCTNNFDHSQETKLTAGYIYTNEKINKVLDVNIQQSKLLLNFNPSSEKEVATDEYLPIYHNAGSTKNSCFNWEKYQDQLSTKFLGQSLIHIRVVNSTFDLLEGPKFISHGLAVIADRQINGRGRGQNSWISPEGCAMTSFQLQYTLSSKQGQYSSLLQHLVSLSVVHALKDLCELSLKWPNDIYYGPNIKMGGVVILSSVLRDEISFNIGLGFNLANAEPTLSFNDLLKTQGIPPLDSEIYFAKVFNCLELFLEMMETEEGMEDIFKLYHQYWLHEKQKVTVISENNDKIAGNVKCIDEHGFLVVKFPSGEETAVQPGNNSFDMMKGLIMPKKFK